MTTVHSTISIQADTKQALDKIKELNQAVSLFNRSVNQQNADAMKSAKALEKQVLGLNFANKFETQLVKMSGSVEQFSQKLDKGKVGFREYREFINKDNDMLEKVAQRRVKLMQSMQVALTGQISGGHRGALITPQQYEGINTATKNLQQFGKQMDLSTQKTILMNEAMRQGAVQLTNWGKNMQWAGRQLTVGLTLPIAGFATIAVKAFSDVEKQLIQIRRVYGDLETTDYEKALGEKELVEAAEAWTKYGVSVADALKVGADVAATGAQGKEAVQQMNEAIRMATLGNFDMAQSQQAIIAMMSGMGVASEDLRKNIDYLNAVENQTLLTMEDVAEAVPRVGPVLKSLGGDVQDLTIFLAAMKEGGVEAAEGANAIKSGFASMINPTTSAREMFKQFGIDLRGIVQAGQGDPVKLIQDLASSMEGLGDLTRQKLIEELFGKFQFARWTALFDNINRAGSQAQETLKLAGMSAADLAQISSTELAKIESSPLIKFQKNLEDLKNALIPIGEVVLKALNPVLEVVGKFATMVSGNEIATWATVLVGGFIAAVGPIKMFAGLIFNLRGALLEFRATLRSMGQPEFLTEAAIQAQLAATALDEFGQEARSGITVLQSQSVAVRDLATEYRKLASSIEAANLEIASSGTNMTRSRPGTAEAAAVARQYKYGRKYATGGTVPGAGSGDTVPAMLSPGEFVVKAAAAKRHRGVLDAMNAGTLQGMQHGTPASRGAEAMIKELVDQYNIGQTLAKEIVDSLVAELKREGKRFTVSQTAIIRQVAEAGKQSGQVFAEQFVKEIQSRQVSAPQQTHLLDKGVTTVGAVGRADVLTTRLRRELDALTQAFGAATRIFLFGPAKFTASTALNQGMRVAGVPIQQYEEETQRTFAATRQQELQGLVPGARPGQMSAVDKAVADYVKSQAQPGKQVLINDKIVNAAVNEIANGAGTMSDEVRQLIVTLNDAGKEVTQFSLAIDKATSDAIKREHGQGMQVGETRNVALPGGATTSLSRRQFGDQAVTLMGSVYGPQGARLAGAENYDTRKGAIRYTPERINTGPGAGRYQAAQSPTVQALLAEQKVVKTIIDEMKRDLKTASPSKETEKIGRDIDKGLAAGMKAGEPEVARAAASVANVALSTLQTGGRAAGHIPTTTTVGGRYGGHIARVTVPAGEQLPRERVPIGPTAARLPNIEGEVAKQAKVAAEAQEEVAKAAKQSAPAIDEETSARGMHIGALGKATIALDAVSLIAMQAEGTLGRFAEKVFMATLALQGLTMGGMTGKFSTAFMGKFGAAREAAKVSKAASTATGVARVGAVAGRGATVAGGVARGVGAAAMAGGPVGLAIAGTVAATAALGYTFYKLNKNANKFDEALSVSTTALEKAGESWGYQVKQLETVKLPGGTGATDEQTKAAKEFIKENLSSQSNYLESIKDETLQQAALTATLTQFIATGAPKEFALEVGKQLASMSQMNFDATQKFIESLYDAEGKLVANAGKQISDVYLKSIAEANKVVNRESGRGSTARQMEQFDVARQFLESAARSAGDSLEQFALLYQSGNMEFKDYIKTVRELNDVVEEQRGKGTGIESGFLWMENIGEEIRGKLADSMIAVNPALETWSDELKSSSRVVEAFALQIAGIDINKLYLMAQAKDMNPDTLIGYVMGAYERVGKAIQPRLQGLQKDRGDAQTKFDSAAEAVTTAEAEATKAQQAIDDMQDSLEATIQPLQDQVYAYDRILDNLGEQRDLLNDQVDVQQEKLDLIDEEIDKIEEARDKQLENIEEITDAQLKSLEAMQTAQDRATSERSAFSSIGQALQAGDVAGALEGQRAYTQEFGANTIQDQIDEVNEWHDKSVDAINDEADTKIDAEKRKQDEIQKTIDGIDKQIEALDKQIKTNERAKDTIQDTITVKEHEFELDKRAADKRLKSANDQIVIAGARKKAAQENLTLLDQEITRLNSMPSQAADAILNSGKKLGLSEAKTKEILSGEAVTQYLKTGTATEIEFTNSDNKKQTIKFSHEGGMIEADKWSGTGKLKADETPRILQAGEYVLKKDAVQTIGKQALDIMNEGNLPPANERDKVQMAIEDAANPFYHTGGLVRQFTAMMQGRMTKKVLKNLSDYGAMRIQAEQDRQNSFANLGNTLAGAMGEPVLAEGGWNWPAPGYAQNSNDYHAKRPGRLHAGWDIGMPIGARVNAIRAGKVIAVKRSSGGAGVWGAIDHGNNLYTRYLHMLDFSVKPGDMVRGGQQIGRADSTGANSSHLHFEITRSPQISNHNLSYDPGKYFQLHNTYVKKMHEGGIVGKDDVPAILQKGELVIPKDKWQYGSGGGAVSMPTYSGGGNTGMTASMPTYSSGTSAASFVPSGGGNSGGGGSSSSYSSNASNAYAVNININNPNASATEIANTVHARINRANKVARR